MADVLVTGGTVSDGRIASLDVKLHGLGARTLDRDTALAWMRDGHSLVPVRKGARLPNLQLVEVGDDHFIRADTAKESSDSLPELD
ncbi:MAG: hypothetical protein H6737_17945 [Alphaproteobacteria bacterium]|nr:hypothetical protein [Alphaproteobacteria bacterium]